MVLWVEGKVPVTRLSWEARDPSLVWVQPEGGRPVMVPKDWLEEEPRETHDEVRD